MLFVAVGNDRWWFNNRTDCCSAEGGHAHGAPAHDKAEKEGKNLDSAQKTDEEEEVDEVGDDDGRDVVRQLLKELAEGIGVCLVRHPGCVGRVKMLIRISKYIEIRLM